MKTFKEYQEATIKTDRGEKSNLWYPCLGLAGEVGEVTEPIKKFYRDGKKIDKEDMMAELGDVLWYLTTLIRRLDLNLEDVAEYNINKLTKWYAEKDKRVGSY